MEQLLTMLGNWKTSLVGLAIAVTTYEMGVGNKIPETKQEWANAAFGVMALLLGLAAKDATTGSKPK